MELTRFEAGFDAYSQSSVAFLGFKATSISGICPNLILHEDIAIFISYLAACNSYSFCFIFSKFLVILSLRIISAPPTMLFSFFEYHNYIGGVVLFCLVEAGELESCLCLYCIEEPCVRVAVMECLSSLKTLEPIDTSAQHNMEFGAAGRLKRLGHGYSCT